MSNRQLWTTALLVSMAAGGSALTEAQFDSDRVRWERLEFRASKLAVTATSEVEIETERVSQAEPHWLQPSTGRPTMPRASEVIRIRVGSVVLGKTSELDLWLEPVSGAAIQRTQLETGKKTRHNRHRSLRFTDTGVFNATYRASEETVDRSFGEWALTEEVEPYPPALSSGTVVTEPSALFYLLAVADLDQKGDQITTHVFSKNRVMRVQLTVQETTTIEVDYTEMTSAGERELRGQQEVVRIRLDGKPVGSGGSDRDFEFLGLRGDVDVFLETKQRLPLQITGNIKYVGKGHVRLQRARLRP